MDKFFEMFDHLFPGSAYRIIRPDSKAPVDAKRLSYRDVADGEFRVGWIIPTGFVVVDIDDANTADRVYKWLSDDGIKCHVFKTVKGRHFIFRSNGSKDIHNTARCLTHLGIKLDYRTEGKGYIVLPFNDPAREWTKLCSETLDDIPYQLTPFNKPGEEPNFVGMKDGGGRNDALFRWVMALRRDNVGTSEDKIKTAKIINKYLFDEPMKESEIDGTVLRDEVIEKLETPATKRSIAEIEDDVAEQIRKDRILRLVYPDVLFVYNGSYYEVLPDRDIESWIATDYAPLFRKSNRDEVIDKVKLRTKVVNPDNDEYWSYVAFENCIVDVRTGQAYKSSPSIFVTTRVNRPYKPDIAKSERVDKFLERCSNGDAEKRQLILEMIGDCLLRKAVFQKMFIIFGEGGTGKSSLLRVITNLLGEDNAAYLSTKDLESTFLPSELYNKNANIGDDIPFTRINDSSVLKKIVSGERIQLQRKFGQPFKFKNFATMIFTTNKLPACDDRTGGYYRRLALIDMNVRVTDTNAFFVDEFTEDDYVYLTNLAMDAIREALERGCLTSPMIVEQNLENYKKMQTTISEFCEDEEITGDDLVGVSTSELYSEYVHYCTENQMKPLGKHAFVSEIRTVFYIGTVNGTDEDGNRATRFAYVTNKTN